VSRRRLIVAVAAVIAATAAAVGVSAVHSGRPSRTIVEVTGTSAAPLRGTDAAWLGLMIAMNESVLVLLERAGPRLTDPALAGFVTTLAGTHRGELADLLGHAERGQVPLTGEHAGHELPGIVTPADLAAIEALRGTAFDSAVRECLREHLEQGARLSASEQRGGTDAATKELARRIEEARRADAAKL
jgi:hypothetical protein